MLVAALAAAAFLCGVTGTWSPCGFSSIETIGTMPGRRRTLAATCLTFAVGALLGGAVMFGALGLLGTLVPGTGGGAAAGAAAALALGAAVAELRSLRIAPQIRRQVPEPWRRSLPLPLAAGLYGALLGVGFATFVLTFGVWALAGVTIALGDPALGLVVGVAFGAGRALPVVVVAPLLTRPVGRRLAETMAERPVLLRRFRFADGVALLAIAVALAAGRATAAIPVARPGSDPSAAGDLLAWQGPAAGILKEPALPADSSSPHHLGGLTRTLPGSDPAVGGALVAWREGKRIRVVRRFTFELVARFSVPSADALAVSDRWLVYRGRRFNGGDRLAARRLSRPGRERTLMSIGPPGQLGRPALDGDTLVLHVARPRSSEIVAIDLRTGRSRVLRSSGIDQLTNPSLLGRHLLYVRTSNLRQQLELGPLWPGRDRALYTIASTARRDAGHEEGYSPLTATPPPQRPADRTLWTTALSPRLAYLTLLPMPRGQPAIVSLPRP